jgi:hypothetical protein
VRVGCSQRSGNMALSKPCGIRLHFVAASWGGLDVEVRPSVFRQSVFELRTRCKAAAGMGVRGCLAERCRIGAA